MPSIDPTVQELATLGLCALMLGGYQFFLRWKVSRDPDFATHAVNSRARARWVLTIMESDDRDVLAVQTLRNSVMAASLMASTAVLLIIGTLNLSTNLGQLGDVMAGLGLHPVEAPHARALGVMLLLTDFAVAFFFFSMAVRFYNHVGYLVNLPAEAGETFTPPRVAAYLNRAGHYYSLGTRTFYICLPLVFWFFGPLFMVLGTVGVIGALYRLDRAPRPGQREIAPG